MRTSRTNGTTTYNYIYNGSQLVQMTVGNNTLHFTYDASGAPVVVDWNGTPYYYVTSFQGDVQMIMNLAGEVVVLYVYDAWGNIVATDGELATTLGELNPLRYRSYVYDSDTGLYYLQSRYYNPEWGRFINADAFVSTGQGFIGNNMYAYCLNRPVVGYDPTGHAFHTFEDRMPGIGFGTGIVDAGSGGGGISGCSGGSARRQSQEIIQREKKYISSLIAAAAAFVGNTSEATTYQNLKDYGFAFYNNTLVIQIPGQNGIGLSYGVIILDQYYTADEYGIKTLQHEYGHRAHMNQIGFVNYTITTAIPSLIGAGLHSVGLLGVHYFSLPWEYVADCYGGVNRGGYEAWASDGASIFWYYTLIVAEMTGGI